IIEAIVSGEAKFHKWENFSDIQIMDVEGFDASFSNKEYASEFVARMNDKASKNFDLIEACRLISHTNPFLYNLFNAIAIGVGSRISWLLEDLVDIFRYVDIPKMLANDNRLNDDPFLYFYEHFLEKYDKETKFKRGVFYTPKPIVKFIVNAVDTILKKDFHLTDGLAHTGRVRNQDGEEEFKVQILDPAIGTGTFLVEVIRKIHEQLVGQAGTWSDYVENLLIPRLNGFEIMMTPYILCHIKLEKQLAETGYQSSHPKRMRVFLTNSLESGNKELPNLFASWLKQEAVDANFVKENAPIMAVMGNPPYGISGYNKSNYIAELTKVYKKDLNEKNIQPLSDDYIKFIRLGENFIEKNKEGIIAYITNNSFLDGRIHRRMREHLLHTFDKIFIVNLHGNARKKDFSKELKDENVFPIMQGVCITVFIKTKQSGEELAKVYYMDLFGTRAGKFNFLQKQQWNESNFAEVIPTKPFYFFVPKDFRLQKEYDKGFALDGIFSEYHSGVETKKDSLVIQFVENEIQQIVKDFQSYNVEYLNHKYYITKSGGWNYMDSKDDLIHNPILTNKVLYRPFDTRFTAYTGKQGFMQRPCYEIMKHFILGENIGLCTCKSVASTNWLHVFMATNIIDRCYISNKGKETTYLFPLYLYEESFGKTIRRPNLNSDIVQKFASHVGLQFTEEKTSYENTFAPIDILDYICGVLHSRKYRTRYNELLRIDFPKILYPRNREYFLQIAALGEKLRNLHLLKDMSFETSYPITGSNIVSKVHFTNNKVYINSEQYFKGVSEEAWNFPIGGYVPAQKWLKDRKNRTLTADDIFHYQKIIAAITHTIAVMSEIDKVI
ncbi:MAG: N-6 DNA methylase, partial [Alphaproteobacteria bacterium]|nr:N-6 DNA methylase [Alphaproteobacteria bacterium]